MSDAVLDLTGEIKKSGAKRILLQLPEGLKRRALEIIEGIENAGIDVVYAAEPTYGACDLRLEEAQLMKCDTVVHVGHSKFYRDIKSEIPVIYYPWAIDIEAGGADFTGIKENSIGVVTSIQHMQLLDKIKIKLEDAGKDAVMGGQILGCWFENAKKIESRIDAFLFVGSGKFHPLGIRTEKPVYTLDIETGKIERLDAERFEKIRYANIFMARNARSFAVLVSTKEGQAELLRNAKRIKDYVQKNGRKAFILVMDEITDGKLAGLQVDAYINTACPRLTDDTFSKPMINATDVEMLFEDLQPEAFRLKAKKEV